MACYQRTVFLRKEFTKLSLLPLPAYKGVHVDSVPKTTRVFLARFRYIVVFVPEYRYVSLAPKRHFVNNRRPVTEASRAFLDRVLMRFEDVIQGYEHHGLLLREFFESLGVF